MMETSEPSSRRVLKWPAIALFVGLALLAIFVWGGWFALRGVGRTTERFADLAERFRTGTVTTTFLAIVVPA